MPNPKRRHSRQRSGKRQSHDALKARQLAKCDQCGATKLPHTICPECGHYGKGKKILETSN